MMSLTVPSLSTILEKCQDEVILKTNKDGSQLLRYNKNKTWKQENWSWTSSCRSIVFNKDNKMVCFSPPKSIPFKDFKENSSDWQMEDIIEGTMINLYYDNDQWEISTKSVIGAKTHFDHPINFDELFYETLNESECSLDMLNTHYVYSFVLQHVKNRIVVPITSSKLYLISMYEIINNANNETTIHIIDKRSYYEQYLSQTKIALPLQRLDYNICNEDYTTVGVMIHDKNIYVRTKVLNPNFLKVKELRGNSSNLCYHYLKLMRKKKIKQYLEYFPECTFAFNEYKKHVYSLTCQLLEKYRSRFIYKNSDSELFTFPLKQHLYNIHSIYVEHRKNNPKFYIQFQTIQSYIRDTSDVHLLYKTMQHFFFKQIEEK